MSKRIIFGNSGAGKSTLAINIAKEKNLAHLDLDTLAWLPEMPPRRAALLDSKAKIDEFIQINDQWVIEGGYIDLIELVRSHAEEIIFMNLDESQCIENAKNRPWEPHKYESKKAQDENLEMLIEWIKQYYVRDDEFSYLSHMSFYDSFLGKKKMYSTNVNFT